MESLNNKNINIQYSLVKHLKLLSESDEKYKNLYATWIIDEKMYTNSLIAISNNFPHYSMHDASHSWSIINKIEMILGEERIKQLTATDTFLILESAFLHDLGMIITEEEQKELWNKMEFKKYIEDIIKYNSDTDLVRGVNYIKDIEDNGIESSDKKWPVDVKNYVTILNADYFRRIHNTRSADIIMNSKYIDTLSNKNNLIPKRIMRLISQISIMHGRDFNDVMSNLYREDNGIATDRIHPRMIACLLRLGDLLDLDNGRFNHVLERTVLMPKSSKDHKEKHQAITHFLVSPQKIEVSAICPNEDVYRATRQWFEWLQDELKDLSSKWSEIVPVDFLGGPPSLGDIKLSIKDNGIITEQLNFKFNIDQKVAFEFIEGSGIYENKLDCIREIIQNALDATKMQIWNDIKIGKYDSFEECRDLINNLQFSSDLPDFIKKLYPLRINLEYIENKDVDEDSEFKIIIEDSGCGISLEDLKRMESVGTSWNSDIEKYKIIQNMPVWMRPTGSFGIGLHSVFMITDKVEIETKAENSNAYNITFISSRNNGYISTNINNSRKKNGTKISFKFKSKFIDYIKISNQNIREELNEMNEYIDLVDSKYSYKKNKRKICALLNSHINNINWIDFKLEGVLSNDNLKNKWIIKNDNVVSFRHNDLDIFIGVDSDRILSTYVKDRTFLSEMIFDFNEVYEYSYIEHEYDLLDLIKSKRHSYIDNKVKIYFKNIFCADIRSREFNILAFNMRLNIVEGNANQILSINRNGINDNELLNKYRERLNKYIVKEVLKKMWKYANEHIDMSDIVKERDLIDMISLALNYNNYVDKIDIEKFLSKNIIFNKWKVRDFKIINSECITLKDIISRNSIMLSTHLNTNSKEKAIKNEIDIYCEGNLSTNRYILEFLGFNCIKMIDKNCYIISKDNSICENHIIIDYKDDNIVRYMLEALYSPNNGHRRYRIYAFKYKDKHKSNIKYLAMKNYIIYSPFTFDVKENIFKKKIDDIIIELKENYKFNDLIKYVYNNSLYKKELENEDYKNLIENAYKELIEDYINFVYDKNNDSIIEKEVDLESSEKV
ncbi:histidine kinase [Clostridium sardiniense]